MKTHFDFRFFNLGGVGDFELSLAGGLELVGGGEGAVGEAEKPGLGEESDVAADLEPELSDSSFKPDLGSIKGRTVRDATTVFLCVF